ncbi:MULTISPECIES: hypothetical protein [unclassified Agarivorans]|uniref:hypothetical protein n=1 Tax=unclassified Agarivorans TaxID=2636026 RepID=UPI0026E24B19|nr:MULTISPECIES: hypothetical protein [unclassified Agarivorans]MDO6687279.1 hypothetical protein [Agarivorans sp. 3_MG-2023]MDO6716794.1 hypothetical protein [Agarivorans sp. 2_MG-2023]
MTTHKKKGFTLLAINFVVLIIAYVLLKLEIGGLLPGILMVSEFFVIIMIAVRYFVYDENETPQSVLDDFAKDVAKSETDIYKIRSGRD